MSNFNVFDVAGSGMSAQQIRLNTTASNIANADSVSSSEGKTYRAREPVFAAMLTDSENEFSDPQAQLPGVSVLGIVERGTPLRAEYKPDHPQADKDGYIHLPNVNIMEEMANMISASRSYQTNADVMNTAKTLMQKTMMLGE